MTDLSNPGAINSGADNLQAAHSWEKAGTGAWIVDGLDISHLFPSISPTDVNAFEIGSSSALDVTFYGGEAWGIGGWLVRDRLTTVTVPDDATTTIYVGLDLDVVVDIEGGESPADVDHIIIGPDSAFDEGDPRAPIWDVEASGGSIANTADRRVLEKPVRWNPDSEKVVLAGASITGEAVLNWSPDGSETIAPLEFSPEAGGSAHVVGLADDPNIGASRAIGFSSGDTPSPPPAWFNVSNGVGYAEGGDRIATRVWALGQFTNYTFSESHDDLHGVSSDDHHTRYSDGDARSAITEEAVPGSVVVAGNLSLTGNNRRVRYDTDQSGDPFHFQRGASTDETALTFQGTNVGIHQTTSPSAPLEVGGETRINGDLLVQGDATLRKTQDWDGNSVEYTDSDGGVIEFVRE